MEEPGCVSVAEKTPPLRVVLCSRGTEQQRTTNRNVPISSFPVTLNHALDSAVVVDVPVAEGVLGTTGELAPPNTSIIEVRGRLLRLDSLVAFPFFVYDLKI